MTKEIDLDDGDRKDRGCGWFLLILFVGIIALPLLSRGLISPLHVFINWLAASCSPEFALYFVFFVLFTILRLLFAPLELTHTRIDRDKAQAVAWLDDTRFVNRSVMFVAFVSVSEITSLIMIVNALGGIEIPHWFFQEKRDSYIWFNNKEPPIQLILVYGVVNFALLSFVRLLFRDNIDVAQDSFLGMHWKDTGHLESWVRGFVYVLVYLWWWEKLDLIGRGFLNFGILFFLLTKVAFNGPLKFISLWLDWRNDLWVHGLARQAIEDPNPNRRQEAAEKLGRLGKWAMPVQPKLEAALHDPNEQVRQSVKAALAQITKTE